MELPVRCRSEIAQMSPQTTARERAKSGRALARLCATLLVLAAGSASIALASAGETERAGLGSEVLIAGWAFVLAALSALYTFERKHRPKQSVMQEVRVSPPASTDAALQTDASRPRPIERLLKKKRASAARGEEFPPIAVSAEPVEAREPAGATRSPPPARPGVTEAGEEPFSVVDREEVVLGTPRAESPEPAPTPAAPAPIPARPASTRLERCAALRAEGRFEEAARVAREGLTGKDEPGPLLIELSRAELGLGRINAAIDTARDAHFASRSRDSIRYLIQLLTETRRFTKEDGDTLLRAAARHPEQPLLRHAAGVYASLYGEPAVAKRELRAALRLTTDTIPRRSIKRDLARLTAAPTGTEAHT